MQDFEERVAVVTGAASGIGNALATRLAEEGMKVVLADIEEPALEAAVTTLRQREFDAIGVPTDVSSEASVQALAQQTLDAYGKVHVLCNNAGVSDGAGLLWEISSKDWQWILSVNLWGVIHGIRAFLPILTAQGEPAHVVNTASLAGLTPASGRYGVTKHAVVALSEALNMQLSLTSPQVKVSVLCPGWVRTNIATSDRNRPAELQSDLGRPLNEFELAVDSWVQQQLASGQAPEDVAAIVLDAIRNERFWVTTTDAFDDAIRARHASIEARTNPQPTPPI